MHLEDLKIGDLVKDINFTYPYNINLIVKIDGIKIWVDYINKNENIGRSLLNLKNIVKKEDNNIFKYLYF